VRKVFIYCIIGAILIAFFSGAWSGQARGRAESDSVYEGRLAIIGKLNESLQSENIELAGINKDLTERNARNEDRLRAAADSLGELDLRASTDYNTVQRLIDNLSRLEQAISVIFANGEN
jgi:hypothetical protein